MLEHQVRSGQLREMIMQELATLQSSQIICEDLNRGVEANVLLALVNGIALDSLIQNQCLTPLEQKMVIQKYLEGFVI